MNTLRLGPEVLLKFAVHDQLRLLCGATAVEPSQISTPTRVAAASATGLLRTALLQPLSVLRTRLTADTGAALRTTPHPPSAATPPAPSAHSATAPPRLYRGILHCAQETWARERFAGLYRGAGVAALTTVPYLALCFGTYDFLSAQLPTDKHSQRQWWFPLAKMGTAAGAPPRDLHACASYIQHRPPSPDALCPNSLQGTTVRKSSQGCAPRHHVEQLPARFDCAAPQ